jgi:hypothetical protein
MQRDTNGLEWTYTLVIPHIQTHDADTISSGAETFFHSVGLYNLLRAIPMPNW